MVGSAFPPPLPLEPRPVWVKICGVRTGEEAAACLEAGVDLVGLNFVHWSRRVIDLETAHRLRACLGSLPVAGVFADQPLEQIRRIALELKLEVLQLHGDESPEVCADLGSTWPLIKAFSVGEAFDAGRLEVYEPFVAAFLFDAPRAGSGRTFDWSRLERLPRRRPFFLAGGLFPGNVAEAIRRVQPAGVDTASGVEIEGRKDPGRIREFCLNARRCA